MGNVYCAICITDLLEPDGRVDTLFAEQLLADGITVHEPVVVSRWPTPQKMIAAIEQLERYKVTDAQEFEGDNHDIEIFIDGSPDYLDGWYLPLLEVTGSPSTQERDKQGIYSSTDIRGFQMHKWPEEDVVDVSCQLAPLCGPLLIVEDSGIVALVEPDGSVQESKAV